MEGNVDYQFKYCILLYLIKMPLHTLSTDTNTWAEDAAPQRDDTISDEQIVTLCKQGNNKGYELLIKKYAGRLLTFLRPRIKSADDADDLLQETLLGFSRTVGNCDASRDLWKWVVSIAANKMRDFLRKQNRSVPTVSFGNEQAGSNDSQQFLYAPDYAPDNSTEAGPDICAKIDEIRAFCCSLMEDLASQNPGHALMFRLRHADNMELADIAEVTGASSKKSVSEMLCKVREKLRRLAHKKLGTIQISPDDCASDPTKYVSGNSSFSFSPLASIMNEAIAEDARSAA